MEPIEAPCASPRQWTSQDASGVVDQIALSRNFPLNPTISPGAHNPQE